MSLENRVLAEAFYVARATPEWQSRPFWLFRRCVVPYIAARQFLILRHEGLPMAFVAWVWERAGEPMPWRVDRYLPSASDFLSDGECCVTELISPQVPVATVMGEVVSWLKLTAMPPRIEFNAERCIVAVHTA
jgi:hemolysin-activating ACP:hemolysin acyltransferase